MSMLNLYREEAAINSVLYVLEQYGGKTDMHKIFKTLYFADQQHLSKYGRTITGDVYIAMNYGPVPSKTDDIFKAVRGDSFFQANELGRYFHFENKYMVKMDEKPDMDWLSKSDIECLDYAIGLCKDKNFNDLTSMSHGLAWSNTQADRAMSFKDILREVGETEDYADYIDNKLKMESSFC